MDSNDNKNISEEEKKRTRRRTNATIAHACSFAALIVILVDFAAFVIGQADRFFTIVGIMVSIALLAIAMLKNPTGSTRKESTRKE